MRADAASLLKLSRAVQGQRFEWELWAYQLAYQRANVWSNAVESAACYALLVITLDDGTRAYAEGTLKPTWSAVSPASLVASLRDFLLPALVDVDLTDPFAVAAQLKPFPENRLAKGLIETCSWQLYRQVQGCSRMSLDLPLSFTLTRQSPRLMVEEACTVVNRYGFSTLKIKGGQGLAVDAEVCRLIHRELGAAITLYVDANSSYESELVPLYSQMLGDQGVSLLEDPCPLLPGHRITAIQQGCALPILVDSACASQRDAHCFFESGARQVSAKPGRIGVGEARRVVDCARTHDAKIVVGLYGESLLGTLLNLSAMADLQDYFLLPAELSFYLGLRDQIMTEQPKPSAGRLRCLTRIDDGLLDWQALHRFRLEGFPQRGTVPLPGA